MTTTSSPRLFEKGLGRQKVPHTLVLARGDKVRHFVLRPPLLVLAATLGSSLMLATIGSAGYLFLHDEIRAAGAAHQDRMNTAYEERIATLRAQLDRSTSRQFLDQERVAAKVDLLLDQQTALAGRYEKLRPLLEQASEEGLSAKPVAEVPVPEPRPDMTADLPTDGALAPLPFGAAEPRPQALERFDLIDARHTGALKAVRSKADGPRAAVDAAAVEAIGRAMDLDELRQMADINTLSKRARERAEAIASVLKTEGIPLAGGSPRAAQPEGGPFVAAPASGRFDAELGGLAEALDQLRGIRASSAGIPLARPVASTTISSTFGIRSDPFLGRAAMHTGLDFVAASGTSVTAAAGGKVVAARDEGGYGLMVEIDHGNGLSTRYGHMSQLLVTEGESIEAGTVVGRVGSTGRSTGPHLHYEVRRSGDPIDPSRYLRAGRRLAALD